MRSLSIIILIILVLAVSGCRSADELATMTAVASLEPEPTQTIVWTPTQEIWTDVPNTPIPTRSPTPSWQFNCVPDNYNPMNGNPCLVPEPGAGEPYMMDFIIQPNGNHGSNTTVIERRDGYYTIDLHGGSGFAGFAGVYIPGMELQSGRCYTLNFTGYLDLRDMPAQYVFDNISVRARVHKDNGEIVELNSHNVLRWDEPSRDWSYIGERDFHWGIYSNDPHPVIGVEVGIDVIWATTRPGNHFRIERVIFQASNNNGNCSGVPGV